MKKLSVNLLGLSFFLLLFASCGYRFTNVGYSDEKASITVPYIQGDSDALLNSELINQLSLTGGLECVQSGGDYILQIILLQDVNDRIGYRYDRDDTTGARRQNILGVENRRTIVAEVTLFDAHTNECIFGPTHVRSFADYDYVDPGSPRDLNTTTGSGTESTIRFSLGQLDSVEGAHDDASIPLYRSFSRQVAESIRNTLSRQKKD